MNQAPSTSDPFSENASAERATTLAALPGPEPSAEQPAPRVEFERPYPLLERPRREGAVEASVEDEKLARWNLGGSLLAKTGANRDGFHAAPRVVVDLITAGERAPTRAERRLLAALRSKGYWPIRLCYEEALRREPQRRGKPLAGETELRLKFGTRARPLRAELGKSELEDRELLECVKARLGALEVGSSAPARAEVRLEIGLWPGDAPLPSVAAAKESHEAQPRLDVHSAEAAMGTLRPGLVACYEQALRRDASLWGRTEFRLELDAEGHVTRAEENESRFPDRSMVTCLLSKLETLKLPQAKGALPSFIVAMRWGSEGPE